MPISGENNNFKARNLSVQPSVSFLPLWPDVGILNTEAQMNFSPPAPPRGFTHTVVPRPDGMYAIPLMFCPYILIGDLSW